MNQLPNLLDFTQEEIENFIFSLGKERYRARQIMKCLYQSGHNSFAEMTTLSREFRGRLAEISRIKRPEVVKILESKDGTKKALLRLEDGLFIESVLIPGKNNWTICISTQAGCAMNCQFCLTARQGFKRNLLPAEITGQILALREKNSTRAGNQKHRDDGYGRAAGQLRKYLKGDKKSDLRFRFRFFQP